MSANESWSQYWAQGHKTSFGNSFSGCYEGKLKDKWLEILTGVTPQSEVLDLCTGNASIIRLAQQSITNFSEITYTGVDYADIAIENDVLSMKNINLLFKVDVTDLPLPANYYDLVTSNFGIEYSDFNKSLLEASRVLKPKGKFEFICHHIDSQLIKSSIKELELLNMIFEQSGAIDCLEGLIVELKRLDDGITDNEAELWRSRVNESLALLAEKFNSNFYSCDFLAFLKHVLKPTIKEKQQEFNFFKLELSGYRTRLHKMVEAAFDLVKSNKFKELSESLGFDEFGCEIIKDENGVVGLRVSATKAMVY